jgi:hypothetical protein
MYPLIDYRKMGCLSGNAGRTYVHPCTAQHSNILFSRFELTTSGFGVLKNS